MAEKRYSITNTRNNSKLKLFYSKKKPFKRNFSEHHHAELEISLFKHGSGRYDVSGRSYDVSDGDIFLFATNEIHCITEINSDMMLMNIHFEPRFIWSLENNLFNAEYLKIFFEHGKDFQNRLDRNNPTTQKIRQLLLEIEDEFVKEEAEYELMIKLKLLNIFVLLVRGYNYTDSTDYHVNEQSLRSVDKAITYINENLSSPLTLDDISHIAGMSRTYFSTLFKKLNGITLWDYITIKRVEKSIELLKKSNCNILDIAIECGVNNTANFNRAFKKMTNKVPSDYINR